MTSNASLESALLFAEAVATLVEAMGMHTENEDRARHGKARAYGEDSFANLVKSLTTTMESTKRNNPTVSYSGHPKSDKGGEGPRKPIEERAAVCIYPEGCQTKEPCQAARECLRATVELDHQQSPVAKSGQLPEAHLCQCHAKGLSFHADDCPEHVYNKHPETRPFTRDSIQS